MKFHVSAPPQQQQQQQITYTYTGFEPEVKINKNTYFVTSYTLMLRD